MNSMGSIARKWRVASLFVGAAAAAGAFPLWAQDDQLADRAKRAGEVLSELTSLPDRSPPSDAAEGGRLRGGCPGHCAGGFRHRRENRLWSGELSHRASAGAGPYSSDSRAAASACRSARSRWTSCSSSSTRTRRARSPARRSHRRRSSVAAGPLGGDVGAATDYAARPRSTRTPRARACSRASRSPAPSGRSTTGRTRRRTNRRPTRSRAARGERGQTVVDGRERGASHGPAVPRESSAARHGWPHGLNPDLRAAFRQLVPLFRQLRRFRRVPPPTVFS